MAQIPRAILSDQFEEQLKGRRLIAAVFLTFRFDPEFFEQEILPVFLDEPLSHAAPIRLVQLEDALQRVPDGVAVYYDQNGLVPEAGPAKLDVRRIAVRHRTGIFHPKNVFVLVEGAKSAQDGSAPRRALLVSSMSANLTRAGWWENVEGCHIEEITEKGTTRLRDDLLSLVDGILNRAGERAADRHEALQSIRSFLRETCQRANRSSHGTLYPHFYSGRKSFTEFLREASGQALDGMILEVISPYFDGDPPLRPLKTLMDEFRPSEVRVYLPKGNSGEVLCSQEVYEWVRSQDRVDWAELQPERGDKSQDTSPRTVHAKVYRFYSKKPAREIIFVGSVNLTSAAHKRGGNLETGFLVEVPVNLSPDWWLTTDNQRPGQFAERGEDEGNVAMAGTRLSIRYWWNSGMGEAYWDDPSPSPKLSIQAQGIERFPITPLPPRQWMTLPEKACGELASILKSTSLLMVIGDREEPGLLLVQEEGMSHRPSLLFDLSPAEILRYWSLLTPAQRAAFLENSAPETAFAGEGATLVSRYVPLSKHDSFFDRFAGIFLGFGNLERAVRKALDDKQKCEREAVYLVFGQKYDSLGSLLKRVAKDASDGTGDLIDHYVIVLCAQQLVNELSQDYGDFWGEHAQDAQLLDQQLAGISSIRERLIERNPSEMPAFLNWFDKKFVKRAAPLASEDA